MQDLHRFSLRIAYECGCGLISRICRRSTVDSQSDMWLSMAHGLWNVHITRGLEDALIHRLMFAAADRQHARKRSFS
jgi:hypothetical protein